MTFGEPDALYLLLALPIMALVAFYASRKRRAAVQRLGDPGLIERLSRSVSRRGRRIVYILWFAALAVAIVALARPQWGSAVQPVEQRGVQMMVALDVSTSMLTRDVKPDRLTRAKLEIADLLERLKGDEVGLVLFSGSSFIQFPPTFDYSTARTFVDNAGPESISREGTALGGAIKTAASAFDEKRPGQKVILLMTDGEADRTQDDPVEAAEDAAQRGIVIYTMGFGSPEGEPVPVLNRAGDVIGYKLDRAGNPVQSKLDEQTLQAIAREARGRYYRASADGSAVEDLVNEIDSLEKATIESEVETVGIERFQPFLLAALLALLAAELVPDRAVQWRPRRRTNVRPEVAADEA